MCARGAPAPRPPTRRHRPPCRRRRRSSSLRPAPEPRRPLCEHRRERRLGGDPGARDQRVPAPRRRVPAGFVPRLQPPSTLSPAPTTSDASAASSSLVTGLMTAAPGRANASGPPPCRRIAAPFDCPADNGGQQASRSGPPITAPWRPCSTLSPGRHAATPRGAADLRPRPEHLLAASRGSSPSPRHPEPHRILRRLLPQTCPPGGAGLRTDDTWIPSGRRWRTDGFRSLAPRARLRLGPESYKHPAFATPDRRASEPLLDAPYRLHASAVRSAGDRCKPESTTARREGRLYGNPARRTTPQVPSPRTCHRQYPTALGPVHAPARQLCPSTLVRYGSSAAVAPFEPATR